MKNIEFTNKSWDDAFNNYKKDNHINRSWHYKESILILPFIIDKETKNKHKKKSL